VQLSALLYDTTLLSEPRYAFHSTVDDDDDNDDGDDDDDDDDDNDASPLLIIVQQRCLKVASSCQIKLRSTLVQVLTHLSLLLLISRALVGM